MSQAAQAVERMVRELREKMRKVNKSKKAEKKMDDDDNNDNVYDEPAAEDAADADSLASHFAERAADPATTETAVAGGDDMAKNKATKAKKPKAAKAPKAEKTPKAAKPKAEKKVKKAKSPPKPREKKAKKAGDAPRKLKTYSLTKGVIPDGFKKGSAGLAILNAISEHGSPTTQDLAAALPKSFKRPTLQFYLGKFQREKIVTAK